MAICFSRICHKLSRSLRHSSFVRLCTTKESDPVTAPEDPEEPTTCCMSGCANCVWIQYAEIMMARHKDGGEKALKAIKNIRDPMMKAFLMMEMKTLESK